MAAAAGWVQRGVLRQPQRPIPPVPELVEGLGRPLDSRAGGKGGAAAPLLCSARSHRPGRSDQALRADHLRIRVTKMTGTSCSEQCPGRIGSIRRHGSMHRFLSVRSSGVTTRPAERECARRVSVGERVAWCGQAARRRISTVTAPPRRRSIAARAAKGAASTPVFASVPFPPPAFEPAGETVVPPPVPGVVPG